MSRTWIYVVVTWLGAVASVMAQPVYVVDQLFVGVHADKSRRSAILELVATGTALEVLNREGTLLNVKTPNGTQCWVEQQFVAAEKPAPLRLVRVEAERDKALKTISSLEAEVENLRLLAQEAVRRTSDTESQKLVTELDRLRGENRELRETIASAETQLAHLAEAHAPPVEAVEPPAPWYFFVDPTELKPWMGWLAVALFGAGLVFGIYAMDYIQRRRHGGFRL